MFRSSVFLSLFFIFFSCGSSLKKGNNLLSKGEYEKAFSLLIKKYKKNRAKNIELAPILQTAYEKSLTKDGLTAKRLQQDLSRNSKAIYQIYNRMDSRQRQIEALLPIEYNGKNLVFTRKDYSKTLDVAKKNYLNDVYTRGLMSAQKGTIGGYREAFSLFSEVQKVDLNFLEVDLQKTLAQEKGFLHIGVSYLNRSFRAIPIVFQNELDRFNNYGFPTTWTRYYPNIINNNSSFDYVIDIDFLNMSVSQRNTETHSFRREKKLSTGNKVVYDSNDQPVLDENGKVKTEEIFETVYANVTRYTKRFVANISADVNLSDQRLIDTRRIVSENEFTESYITFSGDARALSSSDQNELNKENNRYPGDDNLLRECEREFIRKLRNVFSHRRGLGLEKKRK